jgi:hypothetical protein
MKKDRGLSLFDICFAVDDAGKMSKHLITSKAILQIIGQVRVVNGIAETGKLNFEKIIFDDQSSKWKLPLDYSDGLTNFILLDKDDYMPFSEAT